MTPGLGIGIGIGIGSNQPPRPNTRKFEEGIVELNLMTAKLEGADIVFAPYAVFKPEGSNEAMVSIVVLRSSDVALNGWTPRDVEAKDLKSAALRDDTFLPSQAFDPSVYGDGLIVAVNIV